MATLPTLATSEALPKSGPFPPPTLLGFLGTASLSATPHGPACPSRASGWKARLPPLGFPVLRAISLCRHAVATTPAGSWRMMSFNAPTTAAFPEILPGRLPHLGLSRPAQRSLTLRPAYSLSRQKRPVASKASTISLPPSSLRLLPAGTTVAGRDSHPLKMHAFARRTVI
jgi:hypothetical protein